MFKGVSVRACDLTKDQFFAALEEARANPVKTIDSKLGSQVSDTDLGFVYYPNEIRSGTYLRNGVEAFKVGQYVVFTHTQTINPTYKTETEGHMTRRILEKEGSQRTSHIWGKIVSLDNQEVTVQLSNKRYTGPFGGEYKIHFWSKQLGNAPVKIGIV